MFMEELQQKEGHNIPSYSTYKWVSKIKNLSFLSPKQDQYSLCISYKEGDELVKTKLRVVREIKLEIKEIAKGNTNILCGVFVPISNISGQFYKRLLSTYNFIFYDVGTKECYCFLWNEAVSSQAVSEIASCIFKILESNVKNVSVFRRLL